MYDLKVGSGRHIPAKARFSENTASSSTPTNGPSMRYTVWSVSSTSSTLLEEHYTSPRPVAMPAKGCNRQVYAVVGAAALYSRVPKTEHRTMRAASSESWRQR